MLLVQITCELMFEASPFGAVMFTMTTSGVPERAVGKITMAESVEIFFAPWIETAY